MHDDVTVSIPSRHRWSWIGTAKAKVTDGVLKDDVARIRRTGLKPASLFIVCLMFMLFVVAAPIARADALLIKSIQPPSDYLKRDVVVIVRGTAFPLRLSVEQFISKHTYDSAHWEKVNRNQWIVRLAVRDSLTRETTSVAHLFVDMAEGHAVVLSRVLVDDVSELSPTEVAQYAFVVMGKGHLLEMDAEKAPAAHAQDADLVEQTPEKSPSPPPAASLSNPYLVRVHARIGHFWTAPPVDISGKDLSATVMFRIDRNGHVGSIKIEKSSGNEYFDMSAQRAVMSAIPLPPFPPDMLDAYMDAHFTFEVGGTSFVSESPKDK